MVIFFVQLPPFNVAKLPVISTQNWNYSLRYCATTALQRRQAWPRWREVAAQKIWPVPEAVVTVLCTPDDGCGWHPKHVEWSCRIISRLFCVVSCWNIVNICIPNFIIICELLMGRRKSQTEKHVSRCAVRKMSCANTSTNSNTNKTQEKRGSASTTGSNSGIS